jgi:hypothetical protein
MRTDSFATGIGHSDRGSYLTYGCFLRGVNPLDRQEFREPHQNSFTTKARRARRTPMSKHVPEPTTFSLLFFFVSFVSFVPSW